MNSTHQLTPTNILFGAAYYAEYHWEERHKKDLDLMVEAGFTVIRVGESVWSTWEPRDGEFDLDWLQPILDGAHERGIKVILGTPTYAVPPWLQTAYPEIAAEQQSGTPTPWGGRQEVDYSHPAFLFHAERIIRAVIARYAQHPAVIGYQVDNEPGLLLFHNHGSFRRFVNRLKKQYGDVETLNREWGLTYWSHRLSDWSDLWVPDGNTLPQYDLAWRRYQADLTAEFIAWQANIVREYSRPDQFVTTCLAYPRPAQADEDVAASLDIAAGNPYYAMQDHLDATQDLAAQTPWTSSSVQSLLLQADRLFSTKQSRFLVTETDAQTIGGSAFNMPPYPGQLQQAAMALISRGAAMIEYWHWHTIPYGTETYWGGVIPHSLEPGRIYRETAQLGKNLAAIGEELDGFEPDGDVAIIWSNDSKFAMEFFPPLADQDGSPDSTAYQRILEAHYRGVIDAGAQARVIHLTQATKLAVSDLVDRYPVLLAPGLYVADDAELALLQEYARAGGHLILGIRTGYGDEEARARVEVAPGRLREAAGVSYEEFSTIHRDVPVSGTADFAVSDGARGQHWIDGLIPEGAQHLATYQHPFFGTYPAIVTNAVGQGRITTVGTVPSPQLARDLIRWAVPNPTSQTLAEETSLPVTIASGHRPDGKQVWFVFNWSWEQSHITLKQNARDLVQEATHAQGTQLALGPWSVLTLIDAE